MIKDTKGIDVGDVVYVVDIVTEWASFRKILVTKVTKKTLLGNDLEYSHSNHEFTFKSSQYYFSKSFHEARVFWIDEFLKKKVEYLRKQQDYFEEKIKKLLNSDDL